PDGEVIRSCAILATAANNAAGRRWGRRRPAGTSRPAPGGLPCPRARRRLAYLLRPTPGPYRPGTGEDANTPARFRPERPSLRGGRGASAVIAAGLGGRRGHRPAPGPAFGRLASRCGVRGVVMSPPFE